MTRDLWLHDFGQSPRAHLPRLVCFPHAGGSAGTYAAWAPVFAETTPVLAVRPPGREERWREHPRGVREVAAAVADVLLADRAPTILFGHSMGALVAWETAVLLRDAAPLAVVVSGTAAPHITPTRPSVRPMTDDDLVDFLTGIGGIGQAHLRHPRLLADVLPGIRADLVACDDYRHTGEPLPVPLVAFGGDADPLVTSGELDAWTELSTVGTTRHTLPGGHFHHIDHPDRFLHRLAEELEQYR
nr:alpha/beta fold hydrolase [Kibdelosporangium sp. MJ126-NF4]CEL16418.1 Thioesterase in siderophore biosynthesis gene cluster [Kibdelosporangium sp. MJ126-NF4]CTQ90370.1 Thioesterase in siderophore biosynthesis gene cluster [Kibdelosporangium sp. MJ126-NF4]